MRIWDGAACSKVLDDFQAGPAPHFEVATMSGGEKSVPDRLEAYMIDTEGLPKPRPATSLGDFKSYVPKP